MTASASEKGNTGAPRGENRVGVIGRCVYLRAIIEFSNCCRQDCLYCGLHRSNAKVARYRMDLDETVKAAVAAWESTCSALSSCGRARIRLTRRIASKEPSRESRHRPGRL